MNEDPKHEPRRDRRDHEDGESRSEANLEMAREGGYETRSSETRLERISGGEAAEHQESEPSAEERAEQVLRDGRLPS